MTNQAFSLVDSPYFSELINTTNPDTNILIPGRSAMKKRIDEMYKEKSEVVYVKLRVIDSPPGESLTHRNQYLVLGWKWET